MSCFLNGVNFFNFTKPTLIFPFLKDLLVVPVLFNIYIFIPIYLISFGNVVNSSSTPDKYLLTLEF